MHPSEPPRQPLAPAPDPPAEPAWTPVDDADAGSFPASDPPPFSNLHAGNPGTHPDLPREGGGEGEGEG